MVSAVNACLGILSSLLGICKLEYSVSLYIVQEDNGFLWLWKWRDMDVLND
jgi:hypothetical protein